jgi:heme exporter protein D
MTYVAMGTAVVSVVGGIIQGSKAKKARKKAEADQRRRAAQIRAFEASRQAVINPYADSTDLSSLATDLSGSMSNPFANLAVATNAAAIAIEEADISLANTLDLLQATGAGAGGATALANAAAKSKQGVSATIETQESENEKLKAQGEQTLQQMQMQEKARVQGIQIAEGGRFQDNQARGKQFEFEMQENRDAATLDRLSGQEGQASQNIAQANAAGQAAIAGTIGGISSGIATAGELGLFEKKKKNNIIGQGSN